MITPAQNCIPIKLIKVKANLGPIDPRGLWSLVRIGGKCVMKFSWTKWELRGKEALKVINRVVGLGIGTTIMVLVVVMVNVELALVKAAISPVPNRTTDLFGWRLVWGLLFFELEVFLPLLARLDLDRSWNKELWVVFLAVIH